MLQLVFLPQWVFPSDWVESLLLVVADSYNLLLMITAYYPGVRISSSVVNYSRDTEFILGIFWGPSQSYYFVQIDTLSYISINLKAQSYIIVASRLLDYICK